MKQITLTGLHNFPNINDDKKVNVLKKLDISKAKKVKI